MKSKLKFGWVFVFLLMLNIISCVNNKQLDDISNKNKQQINEEEINRENINLEINQLNDKLNEKYMLLANKDNLLGEDYIPDDLVTSTIKFQDYIVTRDLDRLVAQKAKEMFEAAEEEGITLLGASGYRSYDIQLNLYNNKVAQVGKEAAEQYLAPPGGSEHQTGYALDILSSDYQSLDEGFENTRASKWLLENSYKFGFILRYPKDKVDITKYEYEPWHYRYVGEENAEDIMLNNLCLEEYIGNINKEIENLNSKLSN